MSKISKFFKGGGSAASKGRGGPSPQEALARLRETEEMLSKKQEYLETRIERELALARQHGTKNRRGEPRVRPGEPFSGDLSGLCVFKWPDSCSWPLRWLWYPFVCGALWSHYGGLIRGYFILN